MIRRCAACPFGMLKNYGFEIVADPVSVKRDSSSASLALARSIDWVVVSAQPDPRFSPNQHFARLHQLKLLLQSRLLLAPGDEMVRR
jgi:hypothetical protein